MSHDNFESNNIEDADFGAIVSVEPDEADKFGALEEHALTPEEAEESRLDDDA